MDTESFELTTLKNSRRDFLKGTAWAGSAALDAAFGFDTLFTSQVLKGVNFICLDNC